MEHEAFDNSDVACHNIEYCLVNWHLFPEQECFNDKFIKLYDIGGLFCQVWSILMLKQFTMTADKI